ncbi:MAG: hypothetical protein ACOYMP_05955 [Nodosilinea sp.]
MSNLPPPPTKNQSSVFLIGSGIAWGIITLLFFLLCSAPTKTGTQPGWFLAGTNILETGAFTIASLLCFRNWKSRYIVSGRQAWFWLGAGLMTYACGNILFFLWGTIWGLDPVVSLGDCFYILSYIFLATGMVKAALQRRLNLEPSQWLIVGGIGLLGMALALFVHIRGAEAISELAFLPNPGDGFIPHLPFNSLLAVKPTNQPPIWVTRLDQHLQSLADIMSILYVIGDALLLIIAATLLVAFWGGRSSQSWILIALATFSLYIADMFFAYAANTNSYVEGSLWEIFWSFSAIFFWLGAVVERAVSIKSRHSPRHRRA